jgi:hypothetical protein
LKFCFDPSPHTDLLRPAGEDAVQVTLTVDSVHPFSKLPQAFARLKAGPMGKVLLQTAEA